MSDAANAAPGDDSGRKEINANPSNDDLLASYQSGFSNEQPEEMSLKEYLELCKKDPLAYATPAERLLAAIGAPQTVETRHDPRLANIFQSQTIQTYKAFDDFYGMEDVIMQVVDHVKHAAQGLEEDKQILYLLGPVGGGKSSLGERFKELMEVNPIYVLKDNETGDLSPVHENPLGLFDKNKHGDKLKQEYGIDPRYIRKHMSPWAAKRVKESAGNLGRFSVVKMKPSAQHQIAISKVEPGDENNQDVSTLTGKTDIRKLEELAQNDPDAYSYSGGLNNGNEGVMEFVEMFKAPIKMLSPLLEATQGKNFTGTEEIGPMPFNGMVLAHSNQSEWNQFARDEKNEAFLDRVNIVKVPYSLRLDEEVQIYKKLLANSDLADKPTAPETLEILAKFAVMTRLSGDVDELHTKMRVYNGENLKKENKQSKSLKDYKEMAEKNEANEGMDSKTVSTRWAYKVLSKTFNEHAQEVGANPVKLFKILDKKIRADDKISAEDKEKFQNIVESHLKPEYMKFIEKEIKKAYLESYEGYGQNIFDRYLQIAEAWLDEREIEDPDTGVLMDRNELDKWLQKIERPSQIHNVSDFRNEVVRYALQFRSTHEGNNPSWTSYEKLKEVIERKMFDNINDMLPVISFGAKSSSEDQEKHSGYIERMKQRGYTDSDVRQVTDFYVRNCQNG